MKTLLTICARSGSKGVKDKNLFHLEGYSLIEHAINQAKEVFPSEQIYFSSDSADYIDSINNYGISALLRSKELANDTAPKIDVIKDIVSKASFDPQFIIDIDVSSPLRRKFDIEEVKNSLNSYNSVITGTHARKNPYYNMVEIKNGIIDVVCPNRNLTSRQTAPKVFDMNASIYGWTKEKLFSDNPFFGEDVYLHEMPYFTAFDIDEIVDLEIVKSLFKIYKNEMSFRYLK